MNEFLGRMRNLSSAEDFFTLLNVSYDPAVLRVARLHILRRMGQYLSEQGLDALTDDQAKDACRMTLARAYQDFVESSPLQERVFKVLKDAVAPANVAFVPLSELAVEEG